MPEETRQSIQDQTEGGTVVEDQESTLKELQKAEEMANRLESRLDSFLADLECLLTTLGSTNPSSNNRRRKEMSQASSTSEGKNCSHL